MFPWAEVLDGLGFPIVVLLLLFSPMILGSLIGHIIRFIKNLFSDKEVDDE